MGTIGNITDVGFMAW